MVLLPKSVKLERCPSRFGGGGPPSAVLEGYSVSMNSPTAKSSPPTTIFDDALPTRGADIIGTSYILSSFTDSGYREGVFLMKNENTFTKANQFGVSYIFLLAAFF